MKTENKAVPTVDEVQTATSALTALHAKMAFLRPLTAPERRQYGRMGTQKVRVTAQRLEAARKHRDALPAAFDLRQFERETALMVALDDCLAAAGRIKADVHDTLLALGSGTVQTGRQVFALIQVMATASDKLGRTVSNLKSRRTTRREKESPAANGQSQAQAPPAETAAIPAEVTPASPTSEGKKAA